MSRTQTPAPLRDQIADAFRRLFQPRAWVLASLGVLALATIQVAGARLSSDVNYYQSVLAAAPGIPGWTHPWYYPPLAGVLVSPLRLVGGEATANIAWSWAIAGMSLLATSLLLLRSGLPGRRWALAYFLATVILLQDIYTSRMECITVPLAVAGLLAYQRGREGISGALLTAGGLIKAWPFLLVGAIGALWGRARLLASSAAILVAMTAAALVTHAYPWSWIPLARGRGLHIESVAGLWGLWARNRGDARYASHGMFYGVTITGPHLEAIALGLAAAVALAIAAVWWRARRILFTPGRRSWTHTHAAFLLCVVSGAMIANRVFSPQFALWLTPLCAVALLHGWLRLESMLALACGVLGENVWMSHYLDLVERFQTLPIALTTLRHLLLISVFALSAARVLSHARAERSAPEATG